MSRLLWVTNMANPEPRAGGGLRSLRLVQAVSGRWPVDVVNVGEGLDEAAYLEASGARSVRQVQPDRAGRWDILRLAARRRLPLTACVLHSSGLDAEVRRAAEAGDVVLLEHGWMLSYLPPSGRVVAVLHNIDAELVAELPATGWRRLVRQWNVLAYRRLVHRVGSRPGCVLTVVSQRDADVMGVQGVVVPNGADVPEPRPALPHTGPVVFIGSMGYRPNAEAVRWWAREVWPTGGLPPLTVIGQSASEVLADLREHPGVDLVGEVPEVSSWLRHARAVAIPITTGSGTRLKVVEALAYGRPVVATGKGVEGVGVDAGIHALVADDPAVFGREIRRVLSDEGLSLALAANGYELALSLSWTRVGELFAGAVARAQAHA